MKKVIMMVALIGAMVAGSQVEASELNRFEKSPVVHEGIVTPCMPINIFGGGSSGIMAMKQMMNFGFRK